METVLMKQNNTRKNQKTSHAAIRRISILFLLVLIPVGLGEALYFFRKGFSPRRLHALTLKETSEIVPETKSILSQPFHYLGRGRQCFAFESEDGKYVLKCPRTDIYQLPLWIRSLPLKKYKEELKVSKDFRKRFVFESFAIANTELKEETGTIAIHIAPSEPSQDKLTLIDKLGIPHRFPMHSTLFILQHKRSLWTSEFLKAKENLDTKEETRLIHALLDVMTLRGKKRIFNRDRSFLRNYGFDGEKAYQIDVGDFYHIDHLDPDFALQKSVRDSLQPIQEWLAKVDPSMLKVIDERLQTLK